MIPIGILWLGGEINYNRYRINFTLPPGISIEETIKSLKQICDIKEIIMNNTIQNEGKFHSLNFIPEAKYTIYAEFNSLEQALDLTDILKIGNNSVWLNHAGTMQCNTCNEIGHLESNHDKIIEIREKRKRIKQSKKVKKGSRNLNLIDQKYLVSDNKYENNLKTRKISTIKPPKKNIHPPVKTQNNEPVNAYNYDIKTYIPLKKSIIKPIEIIGRTILKENHKNTIKKIFIIKKTPAIRKNEPEREDVNWKLIKESSQSYNETASKSPKLSPSSEINSSTLMTDFPEINVSKIENPFLHKKEKKEKLIVEPLISIYNTQNKKKFENPFINKDEKEIYKNKKIQILESRMFQDMIRPLCTILFIEASDNLTDPKKWLKITHSPLRKNNVLPVQVEEEIIIPNPRRLCEKIIRKNFGFINISGIGKDDLSRRQLRNVMIENDITILGIAETWLKDKVYIDGFVWIGNNGPIVGYRGSGGTGLLIHNSLANEITWIETNNHRITAAKIEDFLIICIYAPVLANHENEKSINEYKWNFYINFQRK
ncbi:unnamed protein product [Blepharisma stoltei]|nr:unnamed protein product [Blepharisma stoltei]CAG9326494.1 unnamed protein product [Blepharisma stoltei]